MAKKPGPARLAFDSEVLRYVAPAYALPLACLAASVLAGVGLFAETWYLLFLPAGGLHALLTLHLASRIAERDRVRTAEIPQDLRQRFETLRAGFAGISSSEGLRALHDLSDEYEQLAPVLDRRRQTDPLAVAHIPALAKETYQQGLSVLEDVLDLMRAINPADRDKLAVSIRDLETEIVELRADPSQAERVRIREERLASQRERLEIMKREQLLTDELIAQSERCGASLHRVRMELAAMRADDSQDSVNVVTETLRKTIDNAKGVQEEMKRLGA